MLEHVGFRVALWGLPGETGIDNALQIVAERLLATLAHRADKRKGKLAADGRRQLRRGACVAQPIDSGHERGVNTHRNETGGERAIEFPRELVLLKYTRLYHCARDLFDKEWHAVAALRELSHHLAGHRFAVRDA